MYIEKEHIYIYVYMPLYNDKNPSYRPRSKTPDVSCGVESELWVESDEKQAPDRNT